MDIIVVIQMCYVSNDVMSTYLRSSDLTYYFNSCVQARVNIEV